MTSSLKLKTPSGGAIAITASDTAADHTIAAPAVTGTMLTTANVKTINGNAIEGTGDLVVSGSGGSLHVIDSTAYGVSSSNPDNSAAFADAYAAAVAMNGGIIDLPAGVLNFASPIVVTQNNVVLRGRGIYGNQDFGTNTSNATILRYAGTSDIPVFINMTCPTPSGTTYAFSVGLGVENLAINGGANTATYHAQVGLQVKSVRKGKFKDIYIINCTAVGLQVSAFAQTSGQSMDTQFNSFERITWRFIDNALFHSAVGMLVTYDNANSNVSFNDFTDCGGYTQNGCPTIIYWSDNNRFMRVGGRALGGLTVAPTALPGGLLSGVTAGKGISHRGGDNNTFITCADVEFRSPVTDPSNGYIASRYILFSEPDLTNGAQVPTLPSDCSMFWQGSDGTSYRNNIIGAVFGGTFADTASQRNSVGTASMLVCNNSDNHMTLATYVPSISSVVQWGIAVPAANGNLRITRFGGAGAVDLSSQQVVFSGGGAGGSGIHINIGSAPSSPNNGDVWFDGTNLKMCIGGVTKTFTLT